MKEHPVDQFFKDHLDQLEVEPSAEVWGKIEHHLEEKRRPWGLYFSIAASFVVLLAIFSYVILRPTGSESIEKQYFENTNPENYITNEQRPKSIQPAGTVPGSENSIPVMAQEGQKKTIAKHTYLNRKTLAMADYHGDESEFSESTLWNIDKIELEDKKASKSKFGISIANSSKYLKPQQEERYKDQLKSYTSSQWDNITSKKKLESPPLPELKLPKFKLDKTKRTAE